MVKYSAARAFESRLSYSSANKPRAVVNFGKNTLLNVSFVPARLSPKLASEKINSPQAGINPRSDACLIFYERCKETARAVESGLCPAKNTR